MADAPNVFTDRRDCSFNMSEEEAEQYLEELSSSLYPQYRIYFGWVPLPLTFITTACSTAYILAICAAMKERKVSRKCYMLLLNRTIGDLLCCGCFFCCSAYFFFFTADQFSVDVMGIIATLCNASYWSAMASYVSLSVLKLFAVYQPLKLKKMFPMSRCFYLVALSWAIYVLNVIVTLVGAAFVRNRSLRKWSGCNREICIHGVARVKNTLRGIIYVFTLVVYILTLVTLKTIRHSSIYVQKKMEKDLSCRFRKRFPFWKLTLNVSTFAIFNLGYIIATVVLVPRSRCSIIVEHPENIGVLSVASLSLLVRILIDAVLGLSTDKQLRHQAVRRCHPTANSQNFLDAKRKAISQYVYFPDGQSTYYGNGLHHMTHC